MITRRTVCEKNELESTMLFGPRRDFFFLFPLTNFIFRTIAMPKASILFYLENILIRGKRQCGLNGQLKQKWSFLPSSGNAAHLCATI